MGSREWAQKLWHVGIVAPLHVESSRTRDLSHVGSIGRWLLIHCAPREVQDVFFFFLAEPGLSFSTRDLHCSTWDLFPDWGSNSGPLPWEDRVLATGPSVSQSVQLLSHVRLFATPWTAAR